MEELFATPGELNFTHRFLAVSPHSDDVAFSIGGMIMSNVFNKLHVITVFSVSSCTEPGIDEPVDIITKIRKQEDLRFFNTTGKDITVLHVDMLDAPLRLGINEDQVFSISISKHDYKETVNIYNHIKSICNQNTLLIAPLAIGGHIDHLIVRNAALMLTDEGYPTAFYEDLPYSGDITKEQIELYVSRIESEKMVKFSAIIVQLGEYLEAKIQKIRAYRSQINDLTIRRILRHANNVGNGIPSERLWVSDNARKILKIKLHNSSRES